MSLDTDVHKAPSRERIEKEPPLRRGTWLRWTVVLMAIGFVGVLIVASNLTDGNGGTATLDPVSDVFQVEPGLVDVTAPFDLHLRSELPLRDFDVHAPFDMHQPIELPLRDMDLDAPYDLHTWSELPFRQGDPYASYDL